MDSETESELVSLVTELLSPRDYIHGDWVADRLAVVIVTLIISLVKEMKLDSQPKPESEFMSLTTQIISLFRSMDLSSHPKPLAELICNISGNEDLLRRSTSLVRGALEVEPEPELMSLIYQALSLVLSMNSSKLEKLISLCPQVEVELEEGKFHVGEALGWRSNSKWDCLPSNWEVYSLTGEDTTHFRCCNCNGENHKEFKTAPVEINHAFHRKHSLQLVLKHLSGTRRCNCCDEYLKRIFYYCSTCDFAINLDCAERPPVLSSIDLPRWHDHTLALFPRKDSLACDACALTQSSGLFYMCPPCDFVIHQSCLSLPCVIKVSRHPHRISYTPNFRQGEWYCKVCRKKIENKFGGYSCIKNGCSYAAHSKCATQSNIWDGEELEGVPEDGEEEEIEPPFVRISDGVIKHFSHQHHHLRLNENTDRDYDESKQCQTCITPIYFGNFYSCMQCDFILHEKCAYFSRMMYHPIHPHLLILVERYEGVLEFEEDICSACHRWFCNAGFFYECSKGGCIFRLHLQCATISEPLVHGSHMHHLFLTSKPGEKRLCSVDEGHGFSYDSETFNCIECNFSLCFQCATLPEKVRYKHDKHMLTLSYGKNTTTKTSWCEVCEKELKLGRSFYSCDEYCSVTMHIECTLGIALDDLYMKAGTSGSGIYRSKKGVHVLSNSHRMTRPICSFCDKRCPRKIVFQCSVLTFCSRSCVDRGRELLA